MVSIMAATSLSTLNLSVASPASGVPVSAPSTLSCLKSSSNADNSIGSSGGYPSRERFLTELTLDPPDATSDQAGVPLLDEDYLILSTIHSAKGQEWKSVYVLNMVDGCVPSDLGAGTSAELEEERRLLYVAMTRAKDDLHLMVPQRFFTHGQRSQGDRHVYASRTRFIPEKLLGLFERTNWPVVAPSAATRGPGQGPRIDIGARMRGMWR
jgi:DNA helicase II / ATP-dependent DNA helicase PcrA